MLQDRADLATCDLPFVFDVKPLEPSIPFEESLFGDGLFLSPSTVQGPSSFPCFADEMEEQARAMEHDLLADTPQLLSGQLEPLKSQPQQSTVPALKVSSTVGAVQQRPMVPVSQHDGSANNRTDIQYHQQQQQRRRQEQEQQPSAHYVFNSQVVASGSTRSAPLAAALHNADCIRSGIRSPWLGAWCGCSVGSWCNKGASHAGLCNTKATIPGLGAYLPEELAAVGLGAANELAGPLPPKAAAAALAAATAAAKASLGRAPETRPSVPKRLKSADKAVLSVPIKPASSGDSITASDNISFNDDEAEQLQGKLDLSNDPAGRTSKRKKMAGAREAAADGGVLNDTLEGTGTDNETASEELKSSITGEAKLAMRSDAQGSLVHPRTTTTKGGGPLPALRNTKGTPLPHAHYGGVGGDGGSANNVSSVVHGLLVSNGAHPLPGTTKHGRAHSRRAPQQWISGEAVDPRTGNKVTVVPPATFCTQCSATNTPVWRAGPFGHKTLCNACGVRWMKITPRARK